jgi:hypothetical protein
MELTDISEIIQGGGNLSLVLSTYFIFKATERLARIEKALDKYIQADK